MNPDFAPIVLEGVDDGGFQVIAEMAEALSPEALGDTSTNCMFSAFGDRNALPGEFASAPTVQDVVPTLFQNGLDILFKAVYGAYWYNVGTTFHEKTEQVFRKPKPDTREARLFCHLSTPGETRPRHWQAGLTGSA